MEYQNVENRKIFCSNKEREMTPPTSEVFATGTQQHRT